MHARAQRRDSPVSNRRRVALAFAVATLGAAALAGCTGQTGVDQTDPDPGPSATSPKPGDSNFVPAQNDACEYLIGVGASDFEAYTGADFSAYAESPAPTSSLQPPLSILVERGGIVCELVGAATEPVVFAWNPISESLRDEVIASIVAEGYVVVDTEGGTELREKEGDVALHLVTNDGWYYSTEARGAEFMRNTIEG